MLRNTKSKREQEKELVSQMIMLYCNKNHHTKGALCPECAKLNDYAIMRSDKCPFMETKTFCSRCKVHCYKPEMRENIRQVMRFSGQRMIFYHPVIAIRHCFESGKEKIMQGGLFQMNRKKINVIDILLTIDFILMAVSGFATHFLDSKMCAITHSVTATLFIVLVVIHIVSHKKIMKAMLSNRSHV
jgi:Zn ribbon nucleic-acid-binding protein